MRPANLKLPSPYPPQKYTPILYTEEDLSSGRPEALDSGAAALSVPGVRVYGDLAAEDLSAGNLVKVRYTVELQNDAYKIFDNSVEKVKSGFSLNVVPRGAAKSVELIGPKGVVSLADALKTGKAFVIGDKDRATVMIDFYLYNDSGAPSYGNGGKIVLPDGKADNVLDTGALWAALILQKRVHPAVAVADAKCLI